MCCFGAVLLLSIVLWAAICEACFVFVLLRLPPSFYEARTAGRRSQQSAQELKGKDRDSLSCFKREFPVCRQKQLKNRLERVVDAGQTM